MVYCWPLVGLEFPYFKGTTCLMYDCQENSFFLLEDDIALVTSRRRTSLLGSKLWPGKINRNQNQYVFLDENPNSKYIVYLLVLGYAKRNIHHILLKINHINLQKLL